MKSQNTSELRNCGCLAQIYILKSNISLVFTDSVEQAKGKAKFLIDEFIYVMYQRMWITPWGCGYHGFYDSTSALKGVHECKIYSVGMQLK